jgi:DNA-binding NarL/FixJ family response regulator
MFFFIEDHHVTVAGFRSLFRPSRTIVRVIGSATSINEAFAMADPSTFDILMVDLWLDENDPFKNLKHVMCHFRNKPVVIYSGETRIHYIKKVFQAGVKGFLYKSCTRDEIFRTLSRVMNGETVYPEVLRQYHLTLEPQNLRTQKIQLTERQKDVITLLCKGLTVGEISEKHLFISPSTIEKTLRILRELYSAKTNIELILIIRQQQIDEQSRNSK